MRPKKSNTKRSYFANLKDYQELCRRMLKPKEYYQRVEDINVDSLKERGLDTVFLDIDNTILPYTRKDLSIQKQRWIDRLKQAGFTLYMVSNNTNKRRIHRVCKSQESYGLYFAMKPSVFPAQSLIQAFDIDTSRAIWVGDQLFTDVLLANYLGIDSILVAPIVPEQNVIRHIQRHLEKRLLRWFKFSS